jgi:hypothetical protein
VKQAAAFLEMNRDLFPLGSLPSYPVQLAALAVSIYRLFSELTINAHNAAFALSDAAIAHAIMAALSEAEAASEPKTQGRLNDLPAHPGGIPD